MTRSSPTDKWTAMRTVRCTMPATTPTWLGVLLGRLLRSFKRAWLESLGEV
ncbi:MAG: hypothetical protein ABIJ09_24425 [Pseudomonadota bacterium]